MLASQMLAVNSSHLNSSDKFNIIIVETDVPNSNCFYYLKKGTSCVLLFVYFQIMEALDMDIGALTQLIGSLGFPIACCIYLIYSNNKANEAHKEEIDKLRQTVENNTHVMIKLCSKLGVDTDD